MTADQTATERPRLCEYCGRDRSILPEHLSIISCVANLKEDKDALAAQLADAEETIEDQRLVMRRGEEAIMENAALSEVVEAARKWHVHTSTYVADDGFGMTGFGVRPEPCPPDCAFGKALAALEAK